MMKSNLMHSATINEKRAMKNRSQREHAYTGFVPRTEEEPQHIVVKNPGILGYKGHRHNQQDMIGTTFTRGLEVVPQPKPVAQSNLGKHDVSCLALPNTHGHGKFIDRPKMSKRSGYGEFDGESGYGQFLGRPKMTKRSGYGEFDGESGYGQFLDRPKMTKRSGYGEFDGESGYGQFLDRPNMSKRSGYGEFDGESGYGQFLCPDQLPHSSYQSRKSNQCLEGSHENSIDHCFVHDEKMHAMYTTSMENVGGMQEIKKFYQIIANTINTKCSKRSTALQLLKRSFCHVDSNGDGKITLNELEVAMGLLSCIFRHEQVLAIFGQSDPTCTGEIDWHLFINLLPL